MLKYAQESGEGYLDLNCGKILRMATGDDLNEERHIRQNAADKLRRCKELIKKHNLPMKLVDCEHLFGGERIIFYFLSETRVDFRDPRQRPRQRNTIPESRCAKSAHATKPDCSLIMKPVARNAAAALFSSRSSPSA